MAWAATSETEDAALVEEMAGRMGGDAARVAQAVAARNAGPRDRVAHGVEGDFLAAEFALDGGVVGAGGVDADEDRRGRVARLHEGGSGLASHLGDQGARDPDREAVEAGQGLVVGGRVAEGEGFLGAHDLAQHRIGEPGRRRRHIAHELDALVDRRVRVLVEEDDLVGADAQGIAHVVADVMGAAQAAVDDLVERAHGGGHAQAEHAGKGPVVVQKVAFGQLGVEHVGRVGLALARQAVYLHGEFPCAG